MTVRGDAPQQPARARALGIRLGYLPTGPLNTITDVAGVAVGHETIIEGSPGECAVRTGVTVIAPHEGRIGQEPLFAGVSLLNGNGELTGVHWIRESGLLTSTIALTNTHSVGAVHEALLLAEMTGDIDSPGYWRTPVVGETWDGILNDTNGMHVRREHVDRALASARQGPVAEGAVGGGTGMVCFGFKGGIGTSSRRVEAGARTHTVGVLVQANHGRRARFEVAGVAVGRQIDESVVPPPLARDDRRPSGAGSIIVVVATDAPLLPHQCQRLARRASLGVARTGGTGENFSGDIFLAFSTGNRSLPCADYGAVVPDTVAVQMLPDAHLSGLFDAVVEATEESILNALTCASTMAGRHGVAFALPHEELIRLMRGRGALH